MTGSIRDYTTNFKFIIPEFNIATWHDYIEQNFRSIDALFHNLFGINGFSGMWKTNSQYTAGQVLFVGEDNGSIYEGRLLKVVNDTNTGGFNTFSEAIEANPKDYEFFTDASSAQLFSELARDWANKTDGTVKTPEGDDTGEYSAKKYAQDSQSSATESEHFRLLAETDKNIALEAAVSAETSAQNSETSAQNALVSEQNSKTSETNAKTSEQNAAISEQNAKSSEDNAKVYETNAANSVETQTNNFNSYNNQLLSTTSTGVSELINTKTSSIVEMDNTLSNALNEIHDKTDVLDKTMITNCLTYVPQDIKLGLNDNIPTLKAGSRVYVPDGFEADGTTPKFNIIITTQDMILGSTWGNAGTMVLYLEADGSALFMYQKGRDTSGTTPPIETNTQIWYDTNNNLIKNYAGGNDTGKRLSFPIAICTKITTTDDYIIESIDQVFNGFGYIGSTVFVLPGVRGLIPDGRNADGSLKNIEHTIDKVLTRAFPGSLTHWIIIFSKNNGSLSCPEKYFYVSETQPTVINQTQVWYKPSTNEMFYSYWENTSTFEKKAGFCCITLNYPTNTSISNFKPYSTFQAVDYNSIPQHIEVSTLPANPNSNTFYYIPS